MTGNDFTGASRGDGFADLKFVEPKTTVNGETAAPDIAGATISANDGVDVVKTTGDTFTDAETVFVEKGDGDINQDINTAITTASEFDSVDTVQVAAGTYEQTVTIDVEGLTLEGPNAGIPGDSNTRGAEARIEAEEGGLDAITIKDTGLGTITIDGVSVKGGTAGGITQTSSAHTGTTVNVLNSIVEVPDDGWDRNGNSIQVSGNGSVVSRNSLEVTGYSPATAPTDFSTSGILVNGASDAVVADNTVSYVTDGAGENYNGIVVGSTFRTTFDLPVAQSIEVRNNTVTEVDTGILATGAAQGTNITNNTIENNEVGIRSSSFESEGEPNDVPSGTQITDNDIIPGNGSVGVDAVADNETPENLDFEAILESNTFGRQVTVKNNAGEITENSIFAAIQPAVDAASSGDTVSIGTGTYEESVTVSDIDGLVITAAEGATPVIDGQNLSSTGAAEGGLIDLAPSSDRAVRNVTISGLTFRNIPADGSERGHAINSRFGENNLLENITIVDNTFDNTEAQSSSKKGAAVYIDQVDGLTVRGNTLRETADRGFVTTANEFAGITVHSPLTAGNQHFEDVTIENNDISGGVRGVWVGDSGISVLNNVTVRDNQISDIDREGIRARASAEDGNNRIELFANDITETGQPIEAESGNILIVNNQIEDGPADNGGIQAVGGDILITNNTITDRPDSGVHIDEDEGGAPITFVDVRNNSITDNEVGVLVDGGTAPGSLVVTRNNIVNNSQGISSSASTIDARLNYYGSEKGPNAEAANDVGLRNVGYDPFLTAPIEDIEVDDVGDTKQFAQDVIAPAGQDVTAVGFPGPVPEGYTVGDAFENAEGGVIYEYDRDAGTFVQVTGSEEISALDAFVIAQNTTTSDESTQVVIEYAKEPADPGSPAIKTVEPGFNLISPRSLGDAYGAFDAPSDRETIYGTYGAPLERSESAFLGPADQDTNFIETTFGPNQDDPVVTPYGGYLVFTQEERQITTFVQTGTTADEVINSLNQTAT
jgi:hypothetical protein